MGTEEGDEALAGWRMERRGSTCDTDWRWIGYSAPRMEGRKDGGGADKRILVVRVEGLADG